jgi:hypothetical protein
MQVAAPVQCTVFKHGSLVVLARVLGYGAAAITQATVQSIAYTVYLLDPHDPDVATAVEDHSAVAIDKAAAVFDVLQTDAMWTVDSTGYNFRHTLDVLTNDAFTIAGRKYRIEIVITPVSGQLIRLRFEPDVL